MDAGRGAPLGQTRAPVAFVLTVLLILVVGLLRDPADTTATTATAPPPPVPATSSVQPVASACRASVENSVAQGVTPTAIRVASTVTLDGPGASLLDTAPVGMRAIVNRVNRAGGICGRRIELTTVNDSWDREGGHATVRRFIQDGHFALVGMPASEGLLAALEHGDVDRDRIPVVGTAGLVNAEFASEWVWPVGSPPTTTMGAVVQHALAHDARRFAVVYDGVHRFGIDGAAAVVTHVEQLGRRVTTTVPIDPADDDLREAARQFEDACGLLTARCDAVVLLMDPTTALAWRDATRVRADSLLYGGPTLLSDEFATACGPWCEGMVAWTPYRPALPPFDTTPGIRTFVRDVRAERAEVDVRNQSLQQGYLGMSVFVHAVQHCSPLLTRDCVRDALNRVPFTSDLVGTLRWQATNRRGNGSVHGYVLRTSGDSSTWEPVV